MKTCILLILPIAFTIFTGFVRAQSPPTSTTVVASNKVASAFDKGMPLLENTQFKVHASRREAPGIAEIHTRDTDVIHVLEGTATLVTGGTAVESKTIVPGEIRGKEIKGGEGRRVSKGDVIVIPNGVPHWFKQVDGPVLGQSDFVRWHSEVVWIAALLLGGVQYNQRSPIQNNPALKNPSDRIIAPKRRFCGSSYHM